MYVQPEIGNYEWCPGDLSGYRFGGWQETGQREIRAGVRV